MSSLYLFGCKIGVYHSIIYLNMLIGLAELCYKMCLSFSNSPKDLDPFSKMVLNFGDFLEEKTSLLSYDVAVI